MSYRVIILPVARQDIKESIQWYNEQKEGLGKLFYAAVKSRIAYIRENPLHYQIEYRNLRHGPVHQLPYLVHYNVNEDEKAVVVLGVTHTSRNPQVWKKRS